MDLKALVQEEKALGKNRATTYRLSTFQEVDQSIFGRKKPVEKLLAIRDEAVSLFSSSDDAMILHYVAGRIKLHLRPHEFNMDLNNVLLSFYDARNWEVAKYIGEMIIEVSENPVALRVLGDVAAEAGDEEKKWNYYERFVRNDHRDKDIIIEVARHFTETGDQKNAAKYLQRALLRLSIPEDADKARRVFSLLLQNGRAEFAFYSSFIANAREKADDVALWCSRELLAAAIAEKEALLKSADKKSEIRKCYDNIIETLRHILSIDSEDENARNTLVEILKEKYSTSSRLNACIRKYNLKRSRNILSDLDEFMKEIAYSKGTFFLQKATRKVGLIAAIDDSKVTVRYSGAEKPQELTLDAAFTTLQPLSNQNIKAIKKGVPAAKIRAKIDGEGGITWLATTLLDSTDDKTGTIKEMKLEMVPVIYSDEEWKKISELLKVEFKNNPYVRVNPGPTEVYELMPFASTLEEKMLYSFNRAKLFYDKCQIMLDSYKSKGIDKTSDAIVEMAQYFEDVVSKGKNTLDETLSAALILEIVTDENDINIELQSSFAEMYRKLTIEEKVESYSQLTGVTLKKAFVDKIVKDDRNAAATLKALVSYYPTYIPDKLRKLNKGREYYEYLKSILENYKNDFAMFCFFFPSVKDDELQKIGMTRDELVKTALFALSSASKDLPDNAENRKLIKGLKKELLESGKVHGLIMNAKDEEKVELKAIILANKGLDTDDVKTFKALFMKKWPELFEEKVIEAPPVEIKTVSGWLCLLESYNQKQEELKTLNTVDIPKILKEINFARELGDLRENAEYQYAKDHKRELDRRIGTLNNELNTVRIVKREDVLPHMTGFGTKCTFHDNLNDRDVVYTFLGRWESDPENGVLDINAPLGQKLINNMFGDTVEFEINGRKYNYTVKGIEVIIK